MDLNSATNQTADKMAEDFDVRLKTSSLNELCKRPSTGLTEVRRDGKDNAAIIKVLTKEFNRCHQVLSVPEFVKHMETFARGCWVSFLAMKIIHRTIKSRTVYL